MTNNRDRSPVAIVGSSFRLPGGTDEALWQALLAGHDLVTTVAPDRWAQDTFLHPGRAEPGTSFTFAAGSIGDIAGFDAAFFGISPREAEQMDPQQRVLLEMAWEAFEQAGIPSLSMRGSRCGVYVGLSTVDYSYRRVGDLASIDATTMTGCASSIAANRLSYVFDLRGPSMTIDTACSSSLVALHQACQSIRADESDTALVAGISLHLHPYGFIGFSKASMLSRQGRCRVFDAGADGYVRSEGGGVVLLKPLAQALADGNRILAVIASTGVNSDGRKPGLTVPSHEGQAVLLREVYRRAGISPSEIDYFEAHGTGTAVGDPIETRAIGEALGRHRSCRCPLPIGSIKGNIGHLEAAAGMAGLFKALHVLRDRRVPANLHSGTINTHIDVTAWNLAPVTEPLALKTEGRLIIGVSAFGFGGTNAHAVLTSYEEVKTAARLDDRPIPGELPNPPLHLSARSPQALRDVARNIARHLRVREDHTWYDIAYTAAYHRDLHSHRLVANGMNRHSLIHALEQFAATGAAVGITQGKHRPEASGPAFIYSGNGSQWLGMGLELLRDDSVFREAVIEVDALYAQRTGKSLLAELHSAPSANRFALTEIAQPALFAIQVGLTRTLERRGIRPIAVCGHSVGEVAAAWASGALTLTNAVSVIHERGRHQARTRGQGCMTAVSLSNEQTNELLVKLQLGERITIAAINSPGAVTLAGDTEAMVLIEATLAQDRIPYQRLDLDYAFHSPAMDPIQADLVYALSELETRAAGLPMYSSVTGNRVGPNTLGANYWWHNVREPVNFEAAVRAMIDAGVNTFIEIGPRAVLTAYLAEIAQPLGAAALVLPSVTRKAAGVGRLSELIEQLDVEGTPRDSARMFPVQGRCVDLPHYPWQRERHWHADTSESDGRLARRVVHPLLGYALTGEPLHWENQLDLAKLPVYADHVVGGGAVLPASGFVEMALAAGLERRRWDKNNTSAPLVIEDLEILAPMLLASSCSRTVRLQLDAMNGQFTIVSRERLRNDPWRTHVTGRLVEDCLASSAPPFEMPVGDPDVPGDTHYEFARTLGLQYGAAFRAVAAAWYHREGIVGAIATPEEIAGESETALLHPVYLDGAFQLLADLALKARRAKSVDGAELPAFLPVRIDRFELLQPRARVTSAFAAHSDSARPSRRSMRADFTLYDAFDAPIATAHGVRFRAVAIQPGTSRPAQWIATHAIPMPRRDPHRAAPLPATDELAGRYAARLHTSERLAARRRFSEEFEPLLDALCAAFAARGLRTLAGDRPIEPRALLESGRVAATSAPLLRNILDLLAEDGVVQLNGDQWEWCPDVTLPTADNIWTSLITDYPEYASLTAQVGSAGLHLAERLRAGTQEDLTIVRHADAISTWAYGCTQQEATEVVEAVADVLRRAQDAQPPHSRLRVLRWVGSCPAEGLDLVPVLDADRCDVVIGAATQSQFDDLRERWPAIDTLPHQIIELDRAVPGDVREGSFDIVVLGEGLADAPDAGLRLKNARHLLFDDGRLVVLERYASRAADFVFGLKPNWWRGSLASAVDSTVRSRLCAPEAWRAVLVQQGFTSIEGIHDVPETPSGPYALIARADNVQRFAPQPQVQPVRTWFVARDATGYSADLGQALADALEADGQRVLTVITSPTYKQIGPLSYALDPCSTGDWDRLLSTLNEPGNAPHGWIHLAGLDLASAAAPPTARAAIQESRAAVFTAWLQTCTQRAIRPECWVIAAHAGTALLPEAAPMAALTESPQVDRLRDAALWGIARVAMHEFGDRRVRWLDLHDPLPCRPNAVKLAQEILHPDAEDEILLTASGRYVPRFRIAPPPRRPVLTAPQPLRPLVQLDCSVPGAFRNLLWRTAPDHQPLGKDEVEIEVRAAGLNFRDVMYAMGLLPDEAVENGFCGPTLGMEVAGIVSRVGSSVTNVAPADAVMAFAPASFANRVRTRSLAVIRKPAHWSFAAGATVPTAFFTAYYALRDLARLQEGERVLIHGAAGGVGIAAIQLSRYLGAEIFATAGTDAKRDFVHLLGADHVFDSRSLAFADDVMRASGGGVDVVLNSLAGEAISSNLRLLRPFGRMLELGKRDFYENSRIGLRPLRNNISYFGIDADQLLAERPETARRVLIELMELFADGSLQPLPHRMFDAADIAAAFRHMQASRHIGKVVVTVAPDFEPLGPPLAELPPVAHADATYVVTGGLSGFGLRSAWWLVRHGARHIALLSRRGADGTPGSDAILEEFAVAGVSVVAPPCDVADAAALRHTLASIDSQMPPLRGIVHAAMVIDDALICDMERGQLHRVLAPKICGALQLHEATRERQLDFFILYSSATTLFGNPGQAAYVAANMALEALATERRALGLPATCIALGPIADEGYLARNERVREALVSRLGGAALRSNDALLALEILLGSSSGNLGLTDLDWAMLGRSLPASQAPKFSALAQSVSVARGDLGTESAHDLRVRLEGLGGNALSKALAEIVRAEVAGILRTAPERVEPGVSLLDMGMDSLMAVELSNLIESRLDIQLSALALSGGPTIESLVERIVRLMHAGDDHTPNASGNASLEAQVIAVSEQHVADLSPAEAAEISAELADSGVVPRSLTARQHT